MSKDSVHTEYEYWTFDKDGRGYCSVFSWEDCLKGHFNDMQVKNNPLGPIVSAKRIKVTTTTRVDRDEKRFRSDKRNDMFDDE